MLKSHKCSKFGQSGLFTLELPALIVEMTTFDLLGMLDSDERLLPFGRLVMINSESAWIEVFANKTSHYVASWYRQPGGTSEDFQLFRDQLDHIRSQHKGKIKFPFQRKVLPSQSSLIQPSWSSD